MTSIMLRSALIRSWLSNILHSSSFILCHCCEFSSHTSRYFLTSVIMVWTFQQRSLVLAHLHAIWRNTYISSLRRSVVQKAKRMRRGESSYTRNGITRRSKRLRDYRVRTLVFRTLQIVSGQFVYFLLAGCSKTSLSLYYMSISDYFNIKMILRWYMNKYRISTWCLQKQIKRHTL